MTFYVQFNCTNSDYILISNFFTKIKVTFFLRASTVGPRALVVQLCYKVGGLPAMLTRTLEMPVEDAFSLASTFLTNQLEETSQANTDEMFCLSLSLSSSSFVSPSFP